MAAKTYATVDELRDTLKGLGFVRSDATVERWTLNGDITVTIREDHIRIATPKYRREFIRGKGGMILAIEALNAMVI